MAVNGVRGLLPVKMPADGGQATAATASHGRSRLGARFRTVLPPSRSPCGPAASCHGAQTNKHHGQHSKTQSGVFATCFDLGSARSSTSAGAAVAAPSDPCSVFVVLAGVQARLGGQRPGATGAGLHDPWQGRQGEVRGYHEQPPSPCC